MIPDKIYIRHYWMPGELDDEWRLKPVEDEQCEEYIRKTPLIEWLESKVYEHNEDKFDDGFNTAIGQVIDKINSL